jgi:hypothetical protein
LVNDFGVDAVIVCMGSDEFEVTDLERKMDGDDKSVFVSRDVENNSPSAQHTRRPIRLLDIGGTFPLGLLRFLIPGAKRLLGIPVPRPKLTKGRHRNDSHNPTIVPKWD